MSGLKDFRDFFAAFLGLIVAGVATTALVLVTALLGVAPPWPNAIVQLTAIAQLLALIFVYQQLLKAGRARINRRMKLGVIGLILVSIIYFSAHSILVFTMPNGELGLRGVICSANATTLYADSCPFLERIQISTAEFEADRLWTPLGLAISRVGLLSAWIGAYVFLINVVAAFVVFQRRQTSSPPGSRSPS